MFRELRPDGGFHELRLGERWIHRASSQGRDYGFDEPELAGIAHPWGTVILSVPALHESFADPWDGFHVGLHEFAHLLGLRETQIGAVPIGFPVAREQEWLTLVDKERERLRRAFRNSSKARSFGARWTRLV